MTTPHYLQPHHQHRQCGGTPAVGVPARDSGPDGDVAVCTLTSAIQEGASSHGPR
jgi:hypothetical protein